MQSFKQQMNFSKREQYAIVFLMVVLFLLVLINSFPELIVSSKITAFHNLDSIALTRGDLLKKSDIRNTDKFKLANTESEPLAIKLHPFPFDPNKLSAVEWKKIGLKDKQIQNILNYVKKGGKFFKKSDLQKIYSLTSAEYAILEPFIVVPEYHADEITKLNPVLKDTVLEVDKMYAVNLMYELNIVDSIQLIGVKDIGPWYAHRILQYRRLLGGFSDKEQLREVYGMDSVRYNQISGFFTVDPKMINLLLINRRTFKELMRHPYMNYNLTKAIVNRREHKGFIPGWNEIVSLNANDSLSILKLKPYLGYN